MDYVQCVTKDGEEFSIRQDLLYQIRNNEKTEKELLKELNEAVEIVNSLKDDLTAIGSDVMLRVEYPSNKLKAVSKKSIHITPIDIANERKFRNILLEGKW